MQKNTENFNEFINENCKLILFLHEHMFRNHKTGNNQNKNLRRPVL